MGPIGGPESSPGILYSRHGWLGFGPIECRQVLAGGPFSTKERSIAGRERADPGLAAATMSNSAPFQGREVRMIPAAKLDFDSQNPRLRETGSPASQPEILATLWRDFAVDEVALSIAANGFFAYEPLFVEPHNGRYLVIEGNRRLAAVRLLADPKARQAVGATDLPRLTREQIAQLETLPAIEAPRQDIWQYVGFKHVNGPQAWRSHSKAEYIAWVHNVVGVSLDEIARHIGDQHSTVRRLYRALMALRQAESAGIYRLDDRWKIHFSFSHLYTGFDYGGIQKFIGLTNQNFSQTPIPSRKLPEFGELLRWLYGSKSRQQPPLVQSQNPDLRVLDEVLLSKDGVAALRQGLPLGISLDISKGDTRLFRAAMVASKHYLQEARGKLLTGYYGEPDLLESAADIVLLAINIRDEMEARRSSPKRPQRTGRDNE